MWWWPWQGECAAKSWLKGKLIRMFLHVLSFLQLALAPPGTSIVNVWVHNAKDATSLFHGWCYSMLIRVSNSNCKQCTLYIYIYIGKNKCIHHDNCVFFFRNKMNWSEWSRRNTFLMLTKIDLKRFASTFSGASGQRPLSTKTFPIMNGQTNLEIILVWRLLP